MSDLSRDDWRRLIDGVQPPSYGEVAAALADAMDFAQDAAFDRVDDAIERGVLVEDEDAGAFGELQVSGEKTVEEGKVESPAPTPEPTETDETDGQGALADAIEWFHARLDDEIGDHTDDGTHPDRPDTAREWFVDDRGFDTETIDEKQLGWVPPNATDQLVAHLHDQGHSRDAMLATGLFTEDLRLLWHGRYVFPYFDRDGHVAYAIARCTGGEGGGDAGYDGHPDDFLAGKYTKLAHSKDHVDVDEPIYGLSTLQRDGPVLITEGVADAIRAHEAGYACLSPVTTQFKHEHREELRDELRDANRPVYVVQDAERPSSEITDEVDGWEALGLEQFGPGLKGGVRTAAFLSEHDIDAYVAELPRVGLDKVDLDDYLGEWSDTLTPVLAGAKPADHHPAYESSSGRQRGEGNSDQRDPGWAESDGLTREHVENALSHVSRTLHYDDWIQLGYAVHDWDSGATGQRIFEQWSRQSPKWEEPESSNAIDWIWENATSPGAGDTTVATLVYRAIEGGWSPPRPEPDDEDYTVDPRTVDVVMDPQRAWKAASRVVPADLDDGHGLPVSNDSEAFTAPQTDNTLDVVRAVAAVEDIAAPDEPLRDADYDRAYRRARDAYGAPLPEYVTAKDAATRWDTAIGAVTELDFFDLERDAFTAEISEADDGGDVAYYIDPTPVDGWRDSESGESVLVFESGTVYDADTEETIDALRLVALEYGLIDTPTGELRGDDFRRAYRLARSDYRAPLPRLAIGTPDVTPVLPDAAELVDDVHTRDQDDLEAAWQEVESLYRDLATSNGDVTVLKALPSLGKTTSGIKAAADGVESTYLAPRKELMEQAAAKAEKYGASYLYLPVFGGGDVNDHAVEEAVSIVRERGKDLLRQEWLLQSLIEQPVFEGDNEDGEDVSLDRATCPTAEGSHGEPWALAVHTARELDYTPRDIHTRAKALFGSELPCQEDGDCEYSEGWDRVSDPENQSDLLIGSYGHAHVESARTTYSRDERGRIDRDERAVVLDEFIGDAYTEDFGPEFLHHAVWLASALRDDVDDRQDLLCEADLWDDDWVRAWVRGDGAEEGQPGEVAQRAVRDLRDLTVAVSTAAEFLEDYDTFASSHDLEAALEELHQQFPDITASAADAIADELRRAVDRIPDQESQDLLNWVRDDIIDSLETYSGVDPEAAIPDVIAGDLRALIDDAVSTARAGHDGAVAMLDAASTALEGGDAGTRELAVYADDGYAHRLAHRLLEGLIAPDGEDGVADRIDTEAFAFDPDADSTTLKHVRIARDDDHYDTVLVDRDHQGATVLSPPSRRAGNGEECPVVGLDATARRDLWSLMLGTDVQLADIHDSHAERARFLRDHLGLQVVQTADRVKPYEGDPGGKDLDADVALLEEIDEQFSGVYNGGARDGESVTVGKPACITTKCVRLILEDDERLDDIVAEWDNYGNITGDNDLGDHTLGAVLGTQHYGDSAVEKMAALAGEEVTRSGHGGALDYGSSIANTYLRHMREDQLMQAILRFTRGDSGAVVFAHTSALRRDLPCEQRGQVVKSWSETATTIARAWQRVPDQEFTVADVVDSVDVTRRQVRRVLNEFTRAGYLEKRDPGEGLANEFTAREQPSAGEVELPSEVDAPLNPDTGRMEHTYTWNVRVASEAEGDRAARRAAGSTLPAPTAEIEGAPPG